MKNLTLPSLTSLLLSAQNQRLKAEKVKRYQVRQ